MLRTSTLVGVVLVAIGGAARAETAVSLGSIQAVQPINANFNLLVDYTLDGGNYSDFALAVKLPPNVTVVLGSGTSWQTFACVADPDGGRTCTWSAPVLDTGESITPQNSLTLRLDRYAFTDAAPVPFSVSLTASYTSPTVPEPVAIDVRASHVIEADGAAIFNYENAQFRGPAYWVAHPDDPARFGYLFTLDYRLRNAGTVTLTDAVMEVTLPSEVTFVRTYAASGNSFDENGNLDITEDPSLAAWTEVGAAANPTIIARVPTNLGVPPSVQHAYSHHLHIELWVPCDKVPTNLQDDWPAAFTTTGEAAANEPTAGGPVERTLTAAGLTIPAPAASGDACGTGEIYAKDHVDAGNVGVDTLHEWRISVTPPKGILPIRDAIIVDPVPPGLELTNVTFLVAAQYSADFDAYSCVLPSDPTFGQNPEIVVADFLDYLDTGACALGVMAGATHAVFYAAQWGETTSGIEQVVARVFTQIPRDYLQTMPAGINPVVNNAWLHASLPSGESFDGLDSASITVVEGSRPRITSYINHLLPNPQVLQKGDSGRASFYFGRDLRYQRPLNPSVEVIVPEGVVVDSVATVVASSPGQCLVAPPPAGEIVAPVDLSGPLRWSFGGVEEDWLLTHGASSVCVYVYVYFTVSEEAVLIDGQQLRFTASITAEDLQPGHVPAPAHADFTMSVLGEIRASVTPECQDDAPPAFRVASINSGGTAISDIVTTVAIPGPGDGVSTVTGVFSGIDEAPAGASFEVSADGASWVPLGELAPAEVAHVRMRHPGIAPLSPPLTFLLRVDPVEDSGQMRARAIMTASPLGLPSDSQYSEPFVLGACPGRVRLEKFWDASFDGVRASDGTEPLLDGWTFEVSGAAGVTSHVSGESGAGAVLVELPPGEYTVTEVLPEESAGTWLTPVGGLARALSVEEYGDYTVSFGNLCTCVDPDPDDCVVPVCQPDGSCLQTGVADQVSCDDGDLCTTGDACASGVCVGSAVTCQALDQCHLAGQCDPTTGQCSTPPAPDGTPCDDAVACTSADTCAPGVCAGSDACGGQSTACEAEGFCNTSTGLCEYVDSPCTPERFYALVVDAQGRLAGAIRCDIGETVSCDENADGTLRVYTDVLSCEP